MATVPVRELVTKWGFDIDKKPLAEMEKGVQNLKSSLTAIGIIATGTAAALFGLAKSVADQGENAAKAAAETGLQVETFQELAFAANQYKITSDELKGVLKDLSVRSFSVLQGNQKQALAFRRLGVQVSNASDDLRDADELLLDLADAFQKMPDSAEKTVLAIEALGAQGPKLIPFLNQGAAGIRAMQKEARRLGVVLGKDAVEASIKFQKNLRKSIAALDGIKKTIGVELLPVISDLLEEFREFVVENRKLLATRVRQFIEALKFALSGMLFIVERVFKIWNAFVTIMGGAEKAMKILTIALTAFLGLQFLKGMGQLVLGLSGVIRGFLGAKGAADAFNLSALFIPIVIGLIVAAIALLIEDFIAFSEGRDSVIGRTINVLEKDFPNAFKVLKATFDLMSAVIDNQIAAWRNLFEFITFGFGKVIDFFKDTVLPFFKDSFIGDLFEKIASPDFLGEVTKGINEVTANVQANTAQIEGRSLAPVVPINRGGGGNRITRINQEFNINADGLSKEEAMKAIESGVEKSMGGILRETERDVAPAVER